MIVTSFSSWVILLGRFSLHRFYYLIGKATPFLIHAYMLEKGLSIIPYMCELFKVKTEYKWGADNPAWEHLVSD